MISSELLDRYRQYKSAIGLILLIIILLIILFFCSNEVVAPADEFPTGFQGAAL